MILFINLQGNPLHAVVGLVVCIALNVILDAVSSSGNGGRARDSQLWLELAAGALGLVVTGLVLAVVLKWLTGRRARQPLHSFASMFAGHGAAGLAAGAAAPQRRQQHSAQRRQQRWDQVVRTLQHLPTDTIATQEELQQLPAHELKARLQAAGAPCKGALERPELVQALLQLGGSSNESCCICCEEYSRGDVVRILPCKHRFHIECVDRWFLSSTDYSRDPACPFCNTRLQLVD